ncbi:MAG: hypothetical protein EBZ47_06195 [Chlamydiae bacterium]|nr:hypothetical protein [Chlamydiota bacterium]
MSLSPVISTKMTQEQPVQAGNSPISKLPDDLIYKLVSFLNEQGIQNFCFTSKKFSKATVVAACRNEPELIKKFLELPIYRLGNIQLFSLQKKLNGIVERLSTQDFLNLKSLKNHILPLRAEIIHHFGTEDTLLIQNIFIDSSPSNFLHCIPEEIAFERNGGAQKIEDMFASPHEFYEWEFIETIKILVNMKKFDRAHDLAQRMHDPLNKKSYTSWIMKQMQRNLPTA